VRTAAQILASDYGVGSDVFSVTSFNELARDGQDADRWNMLHPTAKLASLHRSGTGQRSHHRRDRLHEVYADQVRAFVPTENYRVLGTDGSAAPTAAPTCVVTSK
jgi:pyruvate dehydrogenase E1 component